jgi:hypothetical protein
MSPIVEARSGYTTGPPPPETENLLDLIDEMEITPRFKSSYSGVDMSGESAMDIFMDRVNPMNKQAHPALPNVIKELDIIRKRRGIEWLMRE